MYRQGSDYSRIRAGDVFSMQYGEQRFLFGRVMKDDVLGGGFPNSLLIYVYKAESESIDRIPALRKEELLLPPILMHRSGWRQGYLRKLRSEEVQSADLLNQHCFYCKAFKKYYDEYGKELSERTEPCGDYSQADYIVLDREISAVLGLPEPQEIDS